MTELIYEKGRHMYTEIYESGVWGYTIESIRKEILELLDKVPSDIAEYTSDSICFEFNENEYYIWWKE